MILVPDWRVVLRRAWSLRLIALSVVLTGIEVALPFFAPDMRPGYFAGASAVVAMAAFASRLFAQDNINHDRAKNDDKP